MYAPFFGLKHEPFSIAPDPRYLFMSERHREALAHLLYGLGGGGGFVLLSGEIGTGKTTVCRLFLEQIPAGCNVAYIFNPKLTVIELLQSICDEFHVAVPRQDATPVSVKTYLDPLNEFLLQAHAAGQNNVLIIDEAQNLSAEVLEQLRLLTNLETRERKLLQIVLIGQPQLREMLARPELEQLAQRVIARYHLDALSGAETGQYIQHRLEVAGLMRPPPFERRALARIHRLSRGVPRRINLLCDRALLGAFAGGKAVVDRAIVDKAAIEVLGPAPKSDALWRQPLVLLGAGLVGGAVFFAVVSRLATPEGPPPVSVRPAVAVAPARAPAVAPPVAAPAQPAIGAPAVLLRDPNQAWRELAQAWQLSPGEGDPCRALAREQVHCFTRKLGLPLIRQLGRPGILALDGEGSARSYAVLTGLTPDRAILRAGGAEYSVALTALAARWDGSFATLWRAPPGYSGAVALGKGGEVVDWVAARMALVAGKPPPSGRAVLDAALRTQVRTFQVSQGLPADGEPGPMTFMQLNRVAGVAEPRLRLEP